MAKGYMSVALLASCLALPAMARAQYLPVGGDCPPPGAQEPTPVAAMIPAAPTPGTPPALKGPTLTLDRTSAFGTEEEYDAGSCQNFGEGCAWYVSAGGIGLDRERQGSTTIATAFPPNTMATGAFVPLTVPVLNANNLPERMDFGVQATIGYRWDRQAIEVTGFYIPQGTTSVTRANPGTLDLPFVNFPASFGASTFLANTDAVALNFQTTLASGEVNYRCQPSFGYGLELLAGVRYVDMQEQFTIIDNTFGLSSPPTVPTDLFSYQTKAHNHIAAGQLGIDWEHPLLRWMAFGFIAKGAWGVNFVDSDVALQRGDGLSQLGHDSRTIFSSVYEGSVYLDFYLWDRCRVRAGYNALFLVNVAEALNQVNFDLSQTSGNHGNSGTVFYHGPMLELHLLF